MARSGVARVERKEYKTETWRHRAKHVLFIAPHYSIHRIIHTFIDYFLLTGCLLSCQRWSVCWPLTLHLVQSHHCWEISQHVLLSVRFWTNLDQTAVLPSYYLIVLLMIPDFHPYWHLHSATTLELWWPEKAKDNSTFSDLLLWLILTSKC